MSAEKGELRLYSHPYCRGVVRNGEAYRTAQEKRRVVREEYRQKGKAQKEREQSLLEEMVSLVVSGR